MDDRRRRIKAKEKKTTHTAKYYRYIYVQRGLRIERKTGKIHTNACKRAYVVYALE